jgi:4-oxalomesaconate hydratase
MSHPVSEKSALVVSAHSADFVWRAGGAIALHALQGYQVHVVCLSFGERGESAKLWRKGNMTEEAVKQVRREEAQAAAEILGASVEFFDIGDYPLRADKETLFRLADVYRRIQPHFVLTHSLHDPYNYDHPLASHLAQEARIIARQKAIAPARKLSLLPGLLFRTAPAGAVQLETRCVAGHHRCLGEKVSGHSVHAGSGASVGILHPRGAAARVQANAISASRPRAISFTAKPSRASSPA